MYSTAFLEKRREKMNNKMTILDMDLEDLKIMLYRNYKNNMKFHKVENEIMSYDKWLIEVFNNKYITLK